VLHLWIWFTVLFDLMLVMFIFWNTKSWKQFPIWAKIKISQNKTNMSIWPDLSLVTLSCTSRPLNCCEVPSRLSTSMVSWFTVSTDNRIWLTVPLISSTNKLCLKTTLQYIPCIQVNITIYTLYSRQHYNIYPVFKSTLQYIPCIQVNITIYTLYSSQQFWLQ